MSCHHGSVPQETRPSTARVLVTDLSGSGLINPTPATEPRECEAEGEPFYLSPEKLEMLCGTGDLSSVTSLEICIDTRENTLNNFGVYLPRLVQLRMNNSIIMSVRDLGTTLSHLQVLWMPRCSLQDLDGISTFSSLKELYVAYNSVSDLSQVGMLENLQLLDLEGNDVDDLVQVQYLGLCGKLQTLTLEGNPVCFRPNPVAVQMADYSYRAAVRELIPQLRYLDDLRVEEEGRYCSSTMGDDWALLRNSIRDLNVSQADTEDEEAAEDARPYSRAASAWLPPPSRAFVRPPSLAGSRPHTGSRPMTATRPGVLSPPGSRPGSADSDLATSAAESSSLTHGAGKILFCGNPVQALRARREKLMTAPTSSTLSPRGLPIHIPEHTYDLEEPDGRERVDVFAELRAWREQHSKRLQAIEKERSPQVLAIRHHEEGQKEDYHEDEDSGGFGTDSSDEEEERKQGDSQDTASPDSSFRSLSPDLHHREAPLPDIASLSGSPNTVFSPSPPLRAIATPSYRKLPGIRGRRLQQSITNNEHLLASSRVSDSPGTGKTSGDSDLAFKQVHQLTRSDVSLLTQPAHIPRPPPVITHVKGQMDPKDVRVRCTVWPKAFSNSSDLQTVGQTSDHSSSHSPSSSAETSPYTPSSALQRALAAKMKPEWAGDCLPVRLG